MVPVERTHLQLGLCESSAQAKESPPLDLVPWLIFGQSEQAQSLQPLRSRAALQLSHSVLQ